MADPGRLDETGDTTRHLRRLVLVTIFPCGWLLILGENAPVCEFLPLAVVLVRLVQAFRRGVYSKLEKTGAIQPLRSMPIMVARAERLDLFLVPFSGLPQRER